MFQILTVITPLFIIIFTTALLQKLKRVGNNWLEVLNEFTLKIGLPVLIFSALARTNFSFKTEELHLLISNSIFLIVSFILAIVVGKILRLKKQMFMTLFICFGFSNIAYIGIPVLTQVAGESIIPTASLIIAVYLFWQFTFGTGYLDYLLDKNNPDIIKNILKSFIKNPLILSVVLGVFVGVFHIAIPSVLIKSLDMISASVTPTVLVVVGLFIGKSKIGSLSQWIPVLAFSLLTLLGLPAIFYFGVKLFGFLPTQFSSSIIEAAMPLAITPFALADKYNLNKEFIARSIVLSTILSMFILPFWISLLVK
jgi:predicted permease